MNTGHKKQRNHTESLREVRKTKKDEQSVKPSSWINQRAPYI